MQQTQALVTFQLYILYLRKKKKRKKRRCSANIYLSSLNNYILSTN